MAPHITRRRIFAAAAFIQCHLLSSICVAENTATLVMMNGNVITGWVKGVDQGKLSFGTDDLGTLSVNWDRVATIVSSRTVLVNMVDGTRHIGVMEEPPEPRQVVLRTDSGLETLAMDQIYEIHPVNRTFLGGLKGSFSVGASFTKSSDVLQFSGAADISRRTRRFVNSLNLNMITTLQTEQKTENITLSFAHLRLYRNRWTVPGVAAYERNESLGIQNRLLAAVGGGRWLVESNRQTLVALAGLAGNLEDTVGEGGGQSSLEAFTGVHFVRYRNHHPKQSLSLTAFVYPSLTDSGRYRAQLNSYWRQEIVVDFIFELSVYGTYDSQPPEGALQTSDYGLVTSIGYSFWP
jgi:hypothetical protein